MSRILTNYDFNLPPDQPPLNIIVSTSTYFLQIGRSTIKKLNGGAKIVFDGSTLSIIPLNASTSVNVGEFGISETFLDNLPRNIKSLMFYPVGTNDLIIEFSTQMVERAHYRRDASGNFTRIGDGGGEGLKVKLPPPTP